jgi:hypothetical protein
VVINMLKHIETDDYVERLIRKTEIFDVEDKISPTLFYVSRYVMAGSLFNKLLNALLRRKVQDVSITAYDTGIMVQPKRQLPMPLKATTLWAAGIVPGRMTKSSKVTLEAAETTFPREHPFHSR